MNIIKKTGFPQLLISDILSEYSGTHHNRHVNYDITYQYEVTEINSKIEVKQ